MLGIIDMKTRITLRQRGRMAKELIRTSNHYQRCVELLDRVDPHVFASGMDFLESEPALARWLSEPARALGGKIPLDVMRSVSGRKRVASILTALAHGAYV